MKIKQAFLRRKSIFLNVLAEEQTGEDNKGTATDDNNNEPGAKDTPATPTPQGTVNFEDLIAKARKDERDKLYPQIEKLKTDKNDLLLVVGERDKELASTKKLLEKANADLAKVNKDVEDGTKTNKTVQELTLTISQLESQLADVNSRYETEVHSLKINAYKDKQIALAGGEIIEEIVTGNTEEEIDASVEQAKQRFAQIQEQALANVQMPRAANPSASQLNVFKEKSVQEIASMTPSEYKEYRKTLGMK